MATVSECEAAMHKLAERLRSPDAALAGAATDAISQWQFQATQLDCVPVDTQATVTVNFQLVR